MDLEARAGATNEGPAGRCAYVVSRYPSVSHTFVMREVAALRERGVEVDTVTVRRTEREDVIGAIAREEDVATHAILPTTPWRLARAHLRALRRSFRAYAATLAEALRDSSGGVRATLWQLFYFAEAILLQQHLDERRQRHVHAHHANVAADVAMIATRFSSRTQKGAATWSFTFHGPTELGDPAGHKLGLKVARADAVVAISEYARARLLELAPGLDGSRIRVIRCGVDPEDYAVREAPSAESDSLRLLTVAMLHPRKGIGTLLGAIARLREDGDAVELTIVGEGPDRERLTALVKRLGLERSVTLAGAIPVEDVPAFYAAADAFCLPSYAEGVPVVLMEAMASGVPVVATRIAGVPELVTDGESGLLVDPGDERALADALSRLAHSPELVATLRANGRKAVARGFSLEESAARLESLFTELAREDMLAP